MIRKNVWVFDDSYTFIDMLKKLDSEGNGFLVIVNSEYKLLGMVTDGDIRRAILDKKEDIWSIINTKPITVSDKTDRDDVLKFLRSIHRRQVPAITENGILTDIIYLDDEEPHFRSNYVVIMAGGLGSRLGELTRDIPKPMLHVGGRPILENIIVAFRDHGYKNFILCVSYKSEVIENYFKDGSQLGVNIVYNHEEKRMGTAGALALIKRKFTEPFFVVNGDILTTVDYHDFMSFHLKSESQLTMCVKKFEQQVPYACIGVTSQGGIISLNEKPVYSHLINTGMYVLNPSIIDHIPQNEFYDMTTLFEEVIKLDYRVMAYNFNSYWVDIGHKTDYMKANNDLNILR